MKAKAEYKNKMPKEIYQAVATEKAIELTSILSRVLPEVLADLEFIRLFICHIFLAKHHKAAKFALAQTKYWSLPKSVFGLWNEAVFGAPDLVLLKSLGVQLGKL